MKLTEKQLDMAIKLAAQGESITKIREAIGIDAISFWRYRLENPTFANSFEHARKEGLEEVADGLLELADKEQDVYRARLKSDNIKWLLSKRKPQVYGDKIDLNINQTVDIGLALREARSRVVSSSDLNLNVEPVTIDKTTVPQLGASSNLDVAERKTEQDVIATDADKNEEPNIFE